LNLEVELANLPPLPARDRRKSTFPYCLVREGVLCGYGEVLCGTAMTYALVGFFTATGEVGLLWVSYSPPVMWFLRVFCEQGLFIFVSLNIAALYCTASDCLIERTVANCFPQPPEVARRLAQSESLGTENFVDADGRTFCVRCLVWRPPPIKMRSHHCSSCQRCVHSFDHHCFLYGRCITGHYHCIVGVALKKQCSGDWRRGNLKHFYMLLGCAIFGGSVASFIFTHFMWQSFLRWLGYEHLPALVYLWFEHTYRYLAGE